MQTLDALVWKLMRSLLWVGSKLYNVKVYGLEHVEPGKAAAFAVKHSSNVDLALILHVSPKKATVFATQGIFVNRAANYFLRVAGVAPLYTSLKDEAISILTADMQAYRKFYNTLKSGGWVAYAPEAKRVLKGVGENIRPEMLIKASELGHNTYLVGIRYRNADYPWLSLLRWPWQSGIEVRIERYDARNKTAAQVTEEVKEAFARLSGLEQKITQSPEGAAVASLSHQR